MVQKHKFTTDVTWDLLDKIIQEFSEMLARENLVAMLETSINKARDSALKGFEKHKNLQLFAAIDDTHDGFGWPTNLQEYCSYLRKFAFYVPNESDSEKYPKAWYNTPTNRGYSQKVFDILCQFYYLIDQKVGPEGQTLQSYDGFSQYVAKYNKVIGGFLDKQESLTPATLETFCNHPMYNVRELYSEDANNWRTFNNFFYRQIDHAEPVTGITPLRPIANPTENHTIVSPADCTFKEIYDIDDDGNVIDTQLGSPQSVNLKHFFRIGNVKDLLGSSGKKFGESFNNGTFVHYFLSPFDYHRFHTPVAGKVLALERIHASTYLSVRINEGNFDAPDSAKDGYQFKQSRGVLVIDAGKDVGLVAILPIGMCQVSGVIMYDGSAGDDPTKPEEEVPDIRDKEVIKGQEFGKFNFGGSDMIMLFQKPRDQFYFFTESPNRAPIHFQYGQTAALLKS